jgi:hypothetical protein
VRWYNYLLDNPCEMSDSVYSRFAPHSSRRRVRPWRRREPREINSSVQLSGRAVIFIFLLSLYHTTRLIADWMLVERKCCESFWMRATQARTHTRTHRLLKDWNLANNTSIYITYPFINIEMTYNFLHIPALLYVTHLIWLRMWNNIATWLSDYRWGLDW